MLRSSLRALWSVIVLVALVGVLAQDIGLGLASLSLLATPLVWKLSDQIIPGRAPSAPTRQRPPLVWLWFRSLSAVMVAVIAPQILSALFPLAPSEAWLAHLLGLGLAVLWFLYSRRFTQGA